MNLLRSTDSAPPWRQICVLVVAGVVALAGLSAQASAATGRTGHDGNNDNNGSVYQPPTRYHDHYQYEPGCDNVNISVRGRDWGVDTIFNVPGSHGQAFLDRNRYNWVERWTNTDTGKWFTMSAHGLFREVSARFVPKKNVPADLIPADGLVGPVYLFTSLDTGNQRTITDSDGTVVYRDVGLVVVKNLFDTMGDHQPGGVSLDHRFVKIVGPHPSMNLDDCEVAAQLTS